MTKVYTELGMWLEEVEPNTVVIGLSPKGQDDMGDIGYLDFIEKETITEDEPFIAVEGSKAVLEFPAPISGKVIAINEKLIDDPAQLSQAASDDAWMVRVVVESFVPSNFLSEDLPII